MLSFLTEGGPTGTQTWPVFGYTNDYVQLPPLSVSETNSTRLYTLIHNLYSILQYTPCSRVLHDKLTGSQLIKKFHAFYGTRRFITAFTRARHLSLSWARSNQSKLQSHFLKIYTSKKCSQVLLCYIILWTQSKWCFVLPSSKIRNSECFYWSLQ